MDATRESKPAVRVDAGHDPAIVVVPSAARLFSDDEMQRVFELVDESAVERTELSPALAARLFTAMANLRFTDADGAQWPVPHHYLQSGCAERAQMMATMMTRARIASDRVFVTSLTEWMHPGLRVTSPYSKDQPGGWPPMTEWWSHTAPLVQVRHPTGLVETVIDPSTQRGPVPLDAWLSDMGVSPGSYRRLTQDQVSAHIKVKRPGLNMFGFPPGEELVWTTDRNTMFAEMPSPEDSEWTADEWLLMHLEQMTSFARLAAVHDIAAAVRAALARPEATAADLVAAVRAGSPDARAKLWRRFPTLHSEAVQRFPAARDHIDAAVGP